MWHTWYIFVILYYCVPFSNWTWLTERYLEVLFQVGWSLVCFYCIAVKSFKNFEFYKSNNDYKWPLIYILIAHKMSDGCFLCALDVSFIWNLIPCGMSWTLMLDGSSLALVIFSSVNASFCWNSSIQFSELWSKWSCWKVSE